MSPMSLIIWNSQGLGSLLIVRHLKDLINRYHPVMVFLMKTKQVDTYYEKIRIEVAMKHAEYVNPTGIRGGLTVWWTREVNVIILGNERNVIDCRVSSGLFGANIFITWVYGDPDFSRRIRNWDTLRWNDSNRRESWICA